MPYPSDEKECLPGEGRMNRQRRYQLNHKAKGMCQLCLLPLAKGSRVHCEIHLLSNRERNRRRGGYQPWRPGGPGRPATTLR